MVAGAAKISVTFQVDADGLLTVGAREESTGIEANIQVKPSYGLRDDEVTRMLQDSYSHAKDDVRARALREQQVEAERMIEDLSAALKLDGKSLLTADEFQCLQVALEELRGYRSNCVDYRELARHIESVAKASENFASRRMDAAVHKALAGHKLEEFEDK